MTPEFIRQAIAGNPELLAMARAEPVDLEALSARLSQSLPPVIVQPFLIGDGTVSNVLGAAGPGPLFCYTLMMAASAPLPPDATPEQTIEKALIWQAWRRLSSGNLDIGLPGVRAQIDAMVGRLPGLTAEGAAAIKALATRPVTIDEITLKRAIWADDGTLLV